MKSFWKGHLLTLILVLGDVIAFCLIWRFAWSLRYVLNDRFSRPINAFQYYKDALPILLVVWLGIMAYFEHYAHQAKMTSLNQVSNVFKAGAGIAIGTALTAFLLTSSIEAKLGRSVILFAALAMTLYVYLSRTGLRWTKEFFIARGHGLTRVAIIGSGETARAVAARIKFHPEIGYELVGYINSDTEGHGASIGEVPVIGGLEGVVDLLLRYRVEEVFLASPAMSSNDKFNLMTECDEAKVDFKVVTPDLLQVLVDRIKIDDIAEMPVIFFHKADPLPLSLVLKRVLDLVIAVPLAIVSLPLMALCAFALKRDSPGPAIFVHERVGQGGRRFQMYKFRTMVQDADPYQPAPENSDDARITRIGRLLRKLSLDELPQVWNVIKGDMSMVGPRPEMPFIVERYEPWQRRRLDVPQGITGLWQVAGRKRLPLHLNLEYDFYYVRNWSLLLDVGILLRTILAVLFGSGAF